VKISLIILLFSISFTAQAGDRLEGISGSIGNSSSTFGWFGGDDEEDKEGSVQEGEEAVQLEGDATSSGSGIGSDSESTQLAGDGCTKEKVYTLDVENADKYDRLEDFPFTYECVIRR